MKRSKSSQQWLNRHFNDPYVKRAQEGDYRSRAVFKLMEIQEKDRLFKPGMIVVDLGAAPGGWSQCAAKWVGSKGRVVALDLLDMAPLPGVDLIQGDFQEQSVLDQLLERLEGQPVDLVLSDMAPNLSGNKAVDQPRAMALVDLAVNFAAQVLKPGGGCVLKVFQGEGFDELLRGLRANYQKVVIRKPQASRTSSKEYYFIAKGFR